MQPPRFRPGKGRTYCISLKADTRPINAIGRRSRCGFCAGGVHLRGNKKGCRKGKTNQEKTPDEPGTASSGDQQGFDRKQEDPMLTVSVVPQVSRIIGDAGHAARQEAREQ